MTKYKINFLSSLSEYSDENMMDASNLASCLAPTLMPIPEDKDQVQYLTHTIELIRTMITHHEEIFPASDDDSPVYEKFAILIPMYEGRKNFFCFFLNKRFRFSEGDEDEDDEGISERSLRRSPSDDGE